LYEVQVEQLGNFQLRIHDQVRELPCSSGLVLCYEIGIAF
jgi:hypothetical protein